MGPTGGMVREWVLQGGWYVNGSYRGGGASMGPTVVAVRAWVLQGLWYMYGSYRGGGT